MVHSDVYLNKYVVSIAPFSIHLPALIALNIFRKLLFFAYFRFFNFSSVFPGGQLTPFACTYGMYVCVLDHPVYPGLDAVYNC